VLITVCCTAQAGVRYALVAAGRFVTAKGRSWLGAAFGDRSRIADLRRTSIYPPAAFGKNWEPRFPALTCQSLEDTDRQQHAHKRHSPAGSSGCQIALLSIQDEWPKTSLCCRSSSQQSEVLARPGPPEHGSDCLVRTQRPGRPGPRPRRATALPPAQ